MQVDESGDTLIHFSEIDKQLSVIEKKNAFVPGSGYELVEGMR
eukprot:gene37568-6547_t